MDINIGKGLTLPVDTVKLGLPADLTPVAAHVVAIGLRNILMDAHASVTREEAGDDVQAQSLAASEKKLAAMYAGEVRTASTREGDPVRAEAIRMATDAIKTALRKAGKKPNKVDPKAIREKALGLITPELLAKAKARVDELRAADVSVDIEGL